MDKSRDPKEWLKRAKSSLVYSKADKVEDLFYEELCFSCQQSAEKSIKAVIVHLGLVPLKTHSFMKLIGQINQRLQVPEFLKEVLSLAPLCSNNQIP